jgi:hypothetical protein
MFLFCKRQKKSKHVEILSGAKKKSNFFWGAKSKRPMATRGSDHQAQLVEQINFDLQRLANE